VRPVDATWSATILAPRAAPGFGFACAAATLGNPAGDKGQIGAGVDAQLCCPQIACLVKVSLVGSDDDPSMFGKKVTASGCSCGQFRDGCLSGQSAQLRLTGITRRCSGDLGEQYSVCFSAGHR
jgi:hypothetical protein